MNEIRFHHAHIVVQKKIKTGKFACGEIQKVKRFFPNQNCFLPNKWLATKMRGKSCGEILPSFFSLLIVRELKLSCLKFFED